MGEGTKQKKIKEGILQGVSSFISKNQDKVPGISVFDVLMNVDCRSAKVFIKSERYSNVSALVKHKTKIYSEIKEVIKSKYLPTIDFVYLEDE